MAKPFTKADKLDGFRASSCASACKSGRCLLTGDDYEDGAEVCCAWDTYMTMAGDDKGSALDADKIAAVFVTMRDADKLRKDPDLTLPAPNAATAALWDDSDDSIFSWSSIAIWALGVATCAYAAWASGDEIRKRTRRAANGGAATHAAVGASDEDPMDFELTPLHAVGFICIASGSLLVLFYLDLYLFVTVAFAASSASSTATVCWRPMIEKLAPGLARRDLFRSPKYGAMSMLDAASASIGIAVASWWLACRDASYAWALQDLFGVCLCVLFLGLIKLNNLRVASMLLGMAFCYDIFFVFISPYFFEESVMVKVATGKGPTKDADFCEKYPDDDGCKSTSLPMLLLLPRGAAAGGGYTMLGLGDIVLPGLLVSFAARYDATLAAARGSAWANSAWPKHFLVVLFGYGVGLAMANVAVPIGVEIKRPGSHRRSDVRGPFYDSRRSRSSRWASRRSYISCRARSGSSSPSPSATGRSTSSGTGPRRSRAAAAARPCRRRRRPRPIPGGRTRPRTRRC